MGSPRPGYWNGLLFPTPRDLPDPGTKPTSLALAGRFFTAEPPGKPQTLISCVLLDGSLHLCMVEGGALNMVALSLPALAMHPV